MFDHGQPVNISVFNQSTVALPVSLADLVPAMQIALDQHFAPVWGTPAKLQETAGPVLGTWSMAFLDDADSPGALAYHTLGTGLPLAKVFVKTVMADAGETISSAASHELWEMLVDPAMNLMVTPDGQTFYPYEVADPVEDSVFAIGGLGMSNFVYPSWFESFRLPGTTQFDHLHILQRPFELAQGGYSENFKAGTWSQIYGSRQKGEAFKKEDRRGHRSEYRKCMTRKPGIIESVMSRFKAS